MCQFGTRSYLATKLDLNGEVFIVFMPLQVRMDVFSAEPWMCPTEGPCPGAHQVRYVGDGYVPCYLPKEEKSSAVSQRKTTSVWSYLYGNLEKNKQTQNTEPTDRREQIGGCRVGAGQSGWKGSKVINFQL